MGPAGVNIAKCLPISDFHDMRREFGKRTVSGMKMRPFFGNKWSHNAL
jgi:hypothetical protein